jgi:hypothetical protein
LARFVDVTLKFPLSYFKDTQFLGQENWKLPYNYKHYYVEAILVSKYADQRDNINGFIIEVPSLNKQRFQVTSACLLKYEKYNFNNFHLLKLEQSLNPKIFKRQDFMKHTSTIYDEENNNDDDDITADRNRQQSPSTADRNRQQTPSTADRNRQPESVISAVNSDNSDFEDLFVNDEEAKEYDQIDQNNLDLISNDLFNKNDNNEDNNSDNISEENNDDNNSEGPAPYEQEINNNDSDDEEFERDVDNSFSEGIDEDNTPNDYRSDFRRNAQGRPNLSIWKDKTPFDIWHFYFEDVAKHTLKCTNLNITRNGGDNNREITYAELLQYIVAQDMMGVYGINDINIYWTTDAKYTVYGCKPPNLSDIISKNLYWYIHKWLRYEDYESPTVDKTYKAWKVKSIIELFRRKCQQMLPRPGEYLAFDEAMLLDATALSPIAGHMPNKPIDRGAKFYCLGDWESKLVFDFFLDDGEICADNSKDYNYGTTGRFVIKLVEKLMGVGHTIVFDNLFSSIPLVCFLAANYKQYCIGTWRKKRGVPDCLIMSKAKSAKPTKANPKGSLRIAHVNDDVDGTWYGCRKGEVYVYSLMDSAQVFFIDSAIGPEEGFITRKNRDGTYTQYKVLRTVEVFNDKMNIIDVIDQIRNGKFSFVLKHSAKKYTDRMFSGLNEFATTNSYNVYRYNKTIVETSAHGFRHQFHCDLARQIMDFVNNSRRSRSAVNISAVSLNGGHSLEKRDEWVGEGKNKRRKRLDCVNCPWQGDLGQRIHRACTTYCPTCNVPLHPECFGSYHASQGFQLINSFGATPFRHRGGRPRNTNS